MDQNQLRDCFFQTIKSFEKGYKELGEVVWAFAEDLGCRASAEFDDRKRLVKLKFRSEELSRNWLSVYIYQNKTIQLDHYGGFLLESTDWMTIDCKKRPRVYWSQLSFSKGITFFEIFEIISVLKKKYHLLKISKRSRENEKLPQISAILQWVMTKEIEQPFTSKDFNIVNQRMKDHGKPYTREGDIQNHSSTSSNKTHYLDVKKVDGTRLNYYSIAVWGESHQGYKRCTSQTLNNFEVDFEDIPSADLLVEGKKRYAYLSRKTRSRWAREHCIKHNGNSCKICGMNFGKVYGERGEGYIHVHHCIPLHAFDREYTVDPIRDLVPVCPNCHAMLHRRPFLSVVQLRNEMKSNV